MPKRTAKRARARALWTLLWSNATTRYDGKAKPLTANEARSEVLWILERRLEDIERCKKEHWLFAYTTLAALSGLSLLLLSKPLWGMGYASIGIAILLWAIWAAAHCATNDALQSARTGKDIAYALMDEPLARTRTNTGARIPIVPRVLAIAVTSATLGAITIGGLVLAGQISNAAVNAADNG